MNGNKFQPVKSLEKPVEVVKGRILAGWAQKSPEPWCPSGPSDLWGQPATNAGPCFEFEKCGFRTLCDSGIESVATEVIGWEWVIGVSFLDM
jgi:hypothetical protein